MAALTPTATITSEGYQQSVWHGSSESYGNQGFNVGYTRDNLLFWLDTSGFINWSTGDHTTTVYRFQDPDMESHRVNFGIDHLAVLRDLGDNVILCWTYSQYPDTIVRAVRYTKPTQGWAAWAAAGGGALTRASVANINWQSAQTDYSRGVGTVTGWHIARTANISNGTLYLSMGGSNTTQNGYASGVSDSVGFTFNLNTGAIITFGTTSSGKYSPYNIGNISYFVANNDYNGRGRGGSQQYAPYSSQGVRIAWYIYAYNAQVDINNQSTVFSQRNSNNLVQAYSQWNIDANGVLTASSHNWNDSTRFGPLRTMDMEAATGDVSTFQYTSTYGPIGGYDGGNAGNRFNSGNQNILLCNIFNGKPTLSTPGGKWNGSQYNPENWTYASTPTNWVFTARSAPTISWVSPTVLRMTASNGTNGAYMDITWNGTDFTFPATATTISGFNSAAKVKAPNATLLDKYTVFSRASAKAETLTTPVSPTGYTWAGPVGSFPEPYVPILKANNGIKFQYTHGVSYTSANTSMWGTDANFQPAPWTSFQFKRVSSGAGTEYYNYTTNAWTSAVVNNATALFPNGGGAAPAYNSTATFLNDVSGTWADNTSYAYSWLFTDPNGSTLASNTRTIATPAVSAAPTAPTPRRLFVYPLNARTSAHILSIENRVLINKIHVVNTSGSAVTMSLNLGGYNILSTQSLAANQTLQINTAITAAVAERLLVTCSADNAVTLWLMGTEGV
jgi:hypothetical protein